MSAEELGYDAVERGAASIILQSLHLEGLQGLVSGRPSGLCVVIEGTLWFTGLKAGQDKMLWREPQKLGFERV